MFARPSDERLGLGGASPGAGQQIGGYLTRSDEDESIPLGRAGEHPRIAGLDEQDTGDGGDEPTAEVERRRRSLSGKRECLGRVSAQDEESF